MALNGHDAAPPPGPSARRAPDLAALAGLRARGRDVHLRDVRGPDDVAALDGDVAVVMLHGEFGEDGQIQRLLEERGLAYTGSGPDACALAMDKDAAKRRQAVAGVPLAPWGMVRPRAGGADEAAVAAAWRAAGGRFPVVVKPNARGSSVGVTLVRGFAELSAAVERAFAYDPEGVMVEAYVAGAEYTAGFLGGEALPLVELQPAAAFYDYDAKYRSDATRYRCPAPVDAGTAAAWQAMAGRVMDALGARDIGRVDFMVGAGGPAVLELNTAPGFTAHSLVPMAARAAGMTLEAVAWRLVELAAARR